MKTPPLHTACILATGLFILGGLSSCSTSDTALPPDLRTAVYRPAKLKPIDSVQTLKVGDKAPNFTLPVVDGKKISLANYRGKKNVVLSFVPAAFTPVCSKQWPGYNISLDLIQQNHTELLGITTDAVPTLHAWTSFICHQPSTLLNTRTSQPMVKKTGQKNQQIRVTLYLDISRCGRFAPQA